MALLRLSHSIPFEEEEATLEKCSQGITWSLDKNFPTVEMGMCEKKREVFKLSTTLLKDLQSGNDLYEYFNSP